MTPEQVKIFVNAAQQISRAQNPDVIFEIARNAARELTGVASATFVLNDGGKCFCELAKDGKATSAEITILQSLADLTTASIENYQAHCNLESQLLRKTEELEEINREIEAFSYSVSHDLRAPLRAINGFAKILRDDYFDKLDQEGKDCIEHITYGSEKMTALIDNLLAYSRLGRKEVIKSVINMNELTEGVIFELEKSVNHNAKISLENLGNIHGDYPLIHQAVFNLVSNAVKFSSKKSHPEISIRVEVNNGDYIYSVSDNGAGFNMKYADRLFGTFQRLHTETEFEGVGVGLALVRRIIAKHKGKTWAHGEVDKGATFTFSLPQMTI